MLLPVLHLEFIASVVDKLACFTLLWPSFSAVVQSGVVSQAAGQSLCLTKSSFQNHKPQSSPSALAILSALAQWALPCFTLNFIRTSSFPIGPEPLQCEYPKLNPYPESMSSVH